MTASSDPRGSQWDNLSRRRQLMLLLTAIARAVLTSAGLLVIYSMMPIGREATVTTVGIMVIGSILVVAMLALQIRALSRSPHPILRVVEALTSVLVVFILAFATVYLSMTQTNPLSFSEPLTKVSSVYFTVTVLATVGFGDITAVSDTARIVVTAQMLLGLTLVAVVVRFIITFAQNLRARQRSGIDTQV
jgi:voltage-gated potassium channel